MEQIPIATIKVSGIQNILPLNFEQQSLAPSSKSNLGTKVYDCVVEKICSGKWMPGEKITETDVAKELGISHVPVREAMEKLRQEGWVERIPNKGIFVRKMDNRTLSDLYEARELIEVNAVKKLAKSITAEQINQLRKVLELRESSLQSGDDNVSRQTDIHFHRLLVHFAGNIKLEQMFESILLQSNRIFFTLTHKLPFYDSMKNQIDITSHLKILAALESHDQKTAEMLISKHIKIAKTCSLKMWELYQEMEKVTLV